MLHQLASHTQQTIKGTRTSTQDLDPRPLANNDHTSVLTYEMYALEPGEIPSRTLTWKLWASVVILSVVPMTIGSLFLFGRFGFAQASVYQFRL